MKWPLLIISFLLTTCLFAQEKQEFEQRIRKENFPQAALEYLQPVDAEARRMRYYFETDGEHKSFEAKFKLNKRHFSVEFNESGILEDIEIDTKLSETTSEAERKIRKWLDSNYPKWRIEKLQFQYVQSGSNVLKELLVNPASLQPNFEMIITVKEGVKVSSWEVLFDRSADFINKRKIVRRSYEFVLF